MTGALVLSLAELDDVSVSKEDDHVLVTCTGHDGKSSIEIEEAHTKITQAGCRVRKTSVHVSPNAEAQVELEVVERDE